MKFKLVVFDLDGVLLNSQEVVWGFMSESYPTLTSEKMQEILNGNFHENLSKFRENNPVKEETDEEREMRVKAFRARKAVAPLHDNMRKLVEKLHASGMPLAINTSAFERNCLPSLENAKIAQYFGFIATADISANKTEKFKIILEHFGVNANETIFITDTLGDVIEAERAGVPTIVVTWGAQPREVFVQAPHKNVLAIVDTAAELEKTILI
jgi:phosphoglycolate phosphatase